MSNLIVGASVEKDLMDAFILAKVSDFQQKLIFILNLRRLDHLNRVEDKELKAIGLTQAQIRELRKSTSELRERVNTRNAKSELVFIENHDLIEGSSADLNSVVIPKEQLKLMELIGEGTFSVVRRASWYHPSGQKLDVAVKILRNASPSFIEELEVEASHLLKLQHSNLIRLYGVVHQPAMMVFELCEGGELLARLRDANKLAPLVTTLLDYCLQIVKALTFLESKHVVHRDVAARNVLLCKNEKIVKLCDFGLMRNLKENERTYTMQGQKRVPFSWCPPESLRFRRFSHASDVWAFGVTAWEIFSYGEDPWIGCRAIDVLKHLDAGDRLEKPRYCSKQIYDLITLCWNINPDLRPKFSLLRTLLLGVKFNIAEVRDASGSNSSENLLQMTAGDRVIVIESSGLMWFGQNERSHEFGIFSRSSVFVKSKSVTPRTYRDTSASGGNSRISLPIRGSFIHAAHGDVLGNDSWGTPEKIDDVYLRNPVTGDPLQLTMVGTSSAVTSAAKASSTRGVSLRDLSNLSKAGLKFDWDDFDAAAFDERFSPNRIKIPETSSIGRASSSTNFYVTGSRPSVVQAATPQNSLFPSSVQSRQVPSSMETGKNMFIGNSDVVALHTSFPSTSSISTNKVLPKASFTNTVVSSNSSTFNLTKFTEGATTRGSGTNSFQPLVDSGSRKSNVQSQSVENLQGIEPSDVPHLQERSSAPLDHACFSIYTLTRSKVDPRPGFNLADEVRKKKVETDISNVLPQPSKLFFGNISNSTAQFQSHGVAERTSQNLVGANNVTSTNTATAVLNLNGVLEPIRLPTSVSTTRSPSASPAPVVPKVSKQSMQQVPLKTFPVHSDPQVPRPLNLTQLPLFSLSNNASMYTYYWPQHHPSPLFGGVPVAAQPGYHSSDLPPRLSPCSPLRIAEGEDVLELLDPLSALSHKDRSTAPSSVSSGNIISVTRAEQMEILYAEAPFADRSRCDQMVAQCKGDMENALRELKIAHLLDTKIAFSRERAREALISSSWDLNAAAELLITS